LGLAIRCCDQFASQAADFDSLHNEFFARTEKPELPFQHSSSINAMHRPVPAKAIEFLRRHYQADYEVMDWMVGRGHLDADYVSSCRERTNYTF